MIKIKTVCLTRGNDHRSAMIQISNDTASDLKEMTIAKSELLAETPWLLGGLAVL